MNIQKPEKHITSSPWITLAILSGLGIIAMSAETMVLPAIPDFIVDLDISYEESSWILAAPLVTGAVMTPIAGKLSDIYSKKKMLLIILGVFILGLLLGATATNPSFIKSLKRMIGEDEHYEKYTRDQMERYAKSVYSMKVLPVNFATKHKEMLGHSKLLLERGYIAINPKFHKLVTSLSTAVDNEGSLDKQLTSYSDIFDAFRLSLQNYYFREQK